MPATPRDPVQKLREHFTKCDNCGTPATIAEGVRATSCDLCKEVVLRTREGAPRFGSGRSPKRALFDDPVVSLPYAWIHRKTIGKLRRFSSSRFLDIVGVAFAWIGLVVSFAITNWPTRARPIAVSNLTSALAVGASVGLFLLVLFELWIQPLHRRIDGAHVVGRHFLIRNATPFLSSTRLFRFLPHRLSAVLIGVGFALVAYRLENPNLLAGALVLDTLVVGIGGMIWMTNISLAAVPPEEYATLLLGGRKAEDIFRWIAWEMYDLCGTFLDLDTKRIRVARKALLDARPEPKKAIADGNQAVLDHLRHALVGGAAAAAGAEAKGDQSLAKPARAGEWLRSRRFELRTWVEETACSLRLRALTRHLDRMENRMLAMRMCVRRCIAMKTMAATEFGIPERRLCDHLFRFSPSIFERRVAKYIRNWRTIVRLVQVRHVSWWRVADLVDENQRIADRIRRRSNYLRLIIWSEGLFEDVRVFAATTSLRDSLTAYASAMARVLEHESSDAALRDYLAAVYLLQKVHPGTDVHRVLANLCEGGIGWCDARSAIHQNRDKELNRIAQTKDADEARRLRDLSDLEKRRSANMTDHKQVWVRWTAALKDKSWPRPPESILSLRGSPNQNLVSLVAAATHNTQWELNHNLEDALIDWLPNRPKVLVITYGNSRSVRDCLKCVVMPLLEKHDRIFVARTSNEFDSRVMAFSLREDDRWYIPESGAELGFGDAAHLLPILADEDVHALVLLGAESFDWDRRFVQTAAAREQIMRMTELRKRLGHRIRIVVLAESYKRFCNLWKETGLYGDHLDQIVLYPATVADAIVTNDRIHTWPTTDSPCFEPSAQESTQRA